MCISKCVQSLLCIKTLVAIAEHISLQFRIPKECFVHNIGTFDVSNPTFSKPSSCEPKNRRVVGALSTIKLPIAPAHVLCNLI